MPKPNALEPDHPFPQFADRAEALRESEARFRGAFEYAPFGMALVGLHGDFLQVNRSLCAMLGYPERELLKKTFQDLTHPEDLEVGLELFHELISGAREFGWLEKRYVRKDGHTIWAQLSTAVVRDAAGKVRYLVSQIQDITERHEAEQMLAEEEARFRAIFEGTGDALVITGLDGLIAEINPAACAMYGYTREEVVGKPLSTLISLDYHEAIGEKLKGIEQGEAFVVQAVDRRRDGTLFDVEVHSSSFAYLGRPHMLAVVRDVTDRVRSVQLLEQRVQERTRELSTLLQISRDVTSTLQLEPLLAKTLDLLAEVVDYDAGAIFALEEHDRLTLLDYRGPWEIRDLPRQWELGQVEHIRMVIDRHQPLTIPDVHARTLRAQAWQSTWGEQLGTLAKLSGSWLGVPLIAKNRVIGTLTLEHSQPGHFTPLHARLALAFANHVAVAMENARLYEATQRLSVLEERHRIARELHDSVSQALYGIGLGARTAQVTLREQPDQAAEAVAYVLELAENALTEMRALLLELRPDTLERGGLVSALSDQLTMLGRRYGLEITAALSEEPALSTSAKEALYRVALEALSNIVKHARARRVSVELTTAGRTVALSIRDDGTGFDVARTFPGHLGLHSMRERVERLGGRLEISSAPGVGTHVRAALPRPEAPLNR
jgi:PAS domain S-box-containing protein